MAGYISIVCLSMVAAVCIVAVFSEFKDTLGQRLGLSMLAVWSILRIDMKIDNPVTEPMNLILHIGLAVFAVSTAWKLYESSPPRHTNLRPIPAEEWGRVWGAGKE